MRRAALWLALAVIALAAAALSLRLSHRGFAGDTYVEIARGTSSMGVARLLASAGVVRHGWQFLAVRILRPRARLQAGEYRFDRPASAWEVFDRLAKGDVFHYDLTVPEGSNLFDIAASLDRIGVISGKDFLKTAGSSSLVRDLAPEALTLEGYLFPDTYRITRHTTAAQLCGQMTRRFRQAWAELGAPQAAHAVVTLASLVEEETALDEERPVVASVFRNRLARGMPLECDPTAIYAALLDGRYQGEIFRSDLESQNRYNTYRYAGLPPGPISNPGLSSLRAAMRPAETGYFYFVVKPDGSGAHVFSKELEAHQRAVVRYRRGNHKTDQARPSQPVPGRGAAQTRH